MLFRADDGLLVCMQQNCIVVFGISPKAKDSRTFIDAAAAEKYIRDTFPAIDLKDQGMVDVVPQIEERDGESHGLWVPDESLEMPGFGTPVKPFRSN